MVTCSDSPPLKFQIQRHLGIYNLFSLPSPGRMINKFQCSVTTVSSTAQQEMAAPQELEGPLLRVPWTYKCLGLAMSPDN